MNISRILFPTDFSSCADNALDFAVAIASASKADLNLVHVYHEVTTPRISIDDLIEANREKLDYAEKKLAELERCIYEKNKDLVVNTFARSGPSHETVLEFIDEKGADMVVMGTHGSSGVREILYGSFAGGILEYAQCPVLVIPDQAVLDKFSSFVYATDHNEIDIAAINNLVDFAGSFKARIKILHISSDQDTETKEEAFKHLLDRSMNSDFEFVTIKGRDVNRLIEHYLQEHPTDLLVMTALRKSLFGRLFHPSHSRRMAYHTSVPLLVFHETDKCCQQV